MEAHSLSIEIRPETGKGAARKLRAKGLIPAVFYGRGAAAVGIAIGPKALTAALTTPMRRNVLLQLEVAGEKQLAMLREVQIDPLSRAVLHLDLYKVTLDQKVVVQVPFATEGRAKGVVAGGEITAIYRELPVRTTPDQIPAEIKVDVTNMALGDSLRTKNLSLPSGVEVLFDAERSLVTCAEPRKLAPEEETAATGAPGAGAGETPAATPAA